MTDLILWNAHVITMDPASPSAELLAIANGTITHVGPNELLSKLKGRQTEIIDCNGKTLLPGFIDAHCHVHGYAEALVSLNLAPKAKIHSIADIQDRVREACSQNPEGSWIRGKGYNEFYLAEKRHPTRWDLDVAAPRHPVKLTHRSGHAHVLNSLALEIVGIGEETGDPPDGFIDRDIDTGLPNGILYGLGGFLADIIPSLDEAELDKGIRLVNDRLISLGITSIQDASPVNGPDQWKRFEDWKNRGALHPRVTMMSGLTTFLEARRSHCKSRHIQEKDLKLGGVKIIADEVTGRLNPSQKELNEVMARIHSAGCQAAIHAIEQTVVEAAGNAIASATEKGPVRDHRHRIEHCSVCPPALLRRLAGLGIVIVTQPSFLYYSGDRYLQAVSFDDMKHLYALQPMLQQGLRVGAGSDFPIADPNPWISIYAAVTRRTESNAAIPQSGVAVLEAIRLHTLGGAEANFEEHIKGSLAPGKLADVIMLNQDPLTIEEDQLKEIQVVMTLLGGRVVSDLRN